MHCFSKSLIVIRRYHHFAPRAANHCCQSLMAVVRGGETLVCDHTLSDKACVQLSYQGVGV